MKSRNNPQPGGRATDTAPSPAPRRLIVNADDFGLSAGVNAGIIEAHRHGILTSTTIMANGPAFAEAVVLAADNPRLGVGLHLNLVRGIPLSPPERVRCLVDSAGYLRPFRCRRMTKVFLAAAEGEYRLQFEKALAAGLRPTHIDFEKHHAWRGALYDLACRLAREYGVEAARILREPVAWSLLRLGWPGWRRAAMALCLRCGTELFGGAGGGLRRPDRILGQTHIGRMDEAAWLRLAGHLPEGLSEVMTHPGKDTAASGPGEMGASWLGDSREAELAALLSPKVKEALDKSGVELVSFRVDDKPP